MKCSHSGLHCLVEVCIGMGIPIPVGILWQWERLAGLWWEWEGKWEWYHGNENVTLLPKKKLPFWQKIDLRCQNMLTCKLRETQTLHSFGWKTSPSCPNFSVVKRVLCVPASSAASERGFSTAGRVLEKRPTSLSPGNVNSLLFLHSNLQWLTMLWTLQHPELVWLFAKFFFLLLAFV